MQEEHRQVSVHREELLEQRPEGLREAAHPKGKLKGFRPTEVPRKFLGECPHPHERAEELQEEAHL